MRIIVCLETMPDPDCAVMGNGEFDFENCNIRLDSFSASALEFALSLKDRFGIAVHAYLLDSFEMSSVFEEVKAAGSDDVSWIKVPFTFDPFRRAEIFAAEISPDNDDIIIAGYHCESCCTNSIPMLIALNKSLPYYPEISSLSMEEGKFILKEFKTGKELEVKQASVVISIRSSRKLRYPSLRERLACREEEHHIENRDIDDDADSTFTQAKETISSTRLEGSTENKVSQLISLMDERGMFQL